MTQEFSHLHVDAELVRRLICSEAGIGFEKIRRGCVKNADWARIVRVAGALSRTGLLMDHPSDLMIQELPIPAQQDYKKYDLW